MADMSRQDGQVEHIGSAPHPMRNLMMAGGALGLAVIIGLFYFFSGRDDKTAGVELDQFRHLMATQCKMDSFAGPTHPELVGLYARNDRMRAVVGEQRGILDRGGANCDTVVRALRSVDYPVQ